MKATYFNKPLEWNITTLDETWPQGGVVKGSLKVRNHSDQLIKLETSGIALAEAEIKKIHSKTPNALKIQFSLPLLKDKLNPSEELNQDFEFNLPLNCNISDKKTSFYLSFGSEFKESHLQLQMTPHPIILKILGLLDTFFRFKLKEYKNSKKGVEFKFIPPASREMANVESMLIIFHLKGDHLQIKFDFQIKKIDTSSPTNKINKDILTIERELSEKQYLLSGQHLHQDNLLKIFEEVLSQVRMKNIF
jgi:sporulation-control protein spo0M